MRAHGNFNSASAFHMNHKKGFPVGFEGFGVFGAEVPDNIHIFSTVTYMYEDSKGKWKGNHLSIGHVLLWFDNEIQLFLLFFISFSCMKYVHIQVTCTKKNMKVSLCGFSFLFFACGLLLIITFMNQSTMYFHLYSEPVRAVIKDCVKTLQYLFHLSALSWYL